MPIKRTIPHNNGMYFITFTCYKWLSLIEEVNGYEIIYGWFDKTKEQGHFINGYVIMPNHVHVLITFVKAKQSINTFIGNGKRFMAYEIIKRLKAGKEEGLLQQLSAGYNRTRYLNNSMYKVWEISFDWKDCRANEFVWQKLNYIHNNPCNGKWRLSANPLEYVHSSAGFYLTGVAGIYPVTNFMEMEDIDLNQRNQG